MAYPYKVLISTRRLHPPYASADVRMRTRAGVTFDPGFGVRNGRSKSDQHARRSDVHRVQSVRGIKRSTGNRQQIKSHSESMPFAGMDHIRYIILLNFDAKFM